MYVYIYILCIYIYTYYVYIYTHIMCIYIHILCVYIYTHIMCIYAYINWNHRSRPHRNLFCAFNSPEKSETSQLGSSSQFGELWLFSKHVWNTHTHQIQWLIYIDYTSIYHVFLSKWGVPSRSCLYMFPMYSIYTYIYIGIYKYPIAIHPYVLFVNSC